MSNDKVQSIMALVDDLTWKALARHPTASIRAQVESAIREAIAAPGVAQGPLTEQEIEGLEVWKQFVGLWPDKRLEIVRTIEAAHGIAAPSPTAEQPERPPYCGSGHCSCIECPYGETNEP